MLKADEPQGSNFQERIGGLMFHSRRSNRISNTRVVWKKYFMKATNRKVVPSNSINSSSDLAKCRHRIPVEIQSALDAFMPSFHPFDEVQSHCGDKAAQPQDEVPS